ncbi:MAG: hypothetical protein EOO41_03180, partial [Methanobacteriota archaeon]
MDNGVAGRNSNPAYVLDGLQSYALEEVRLTRGGTLRWLPPAPGTNVSVVSVGRLSGDSSGTLMVDARVTMLLSSHPMWQLPGAGELELPVIDASLSSSNNDGASASMWSVTQQRWFGVDTSGLAFSNASVTVSAGGVLVTPPSMLLSGNNTLTVAGVLQGLRDVSIGTNGSLVVSGSIPGLRDVTLLGAGSGVQLTSSGSAMGGDPTYAGDGSGMNMSAGVYTLRYVSVAPGSNLTIGAGVRVRATNVSIASTAPGMSLGNNSQLDVLDVLALRNGSRVSVSGSVRVSSGEAVFETGSVVTGVGAGYASDTGPGSYAVSASGGAHAGCGGQGGCSTSPIATSNKAYGSVFAPSMMGSGGYSYYSYAGGAGGGALRLTVSGSARLDGTIDMSAAPTATTTAGGGGAGGSVWVSVGTLASSSGLLQANGGHGYSGYNAHGGSGGRIALTCGAHSYASSSWGDWGLRFSTTGGSQWNGAAYIAPYAAPGTVYVNCGSRNHTLWVDNGVAGRNSNPAYVLDGLQSYALEEVRLTR